MRRTKSIKVITLSFVPGNYVSFIIAPSEEANLNYYQEYCRLFIANVVLTT